MNERMKDLLQQARMECFSLGSKQATTITYEELDKLLELVVKECVGLAKLAVLSNTSMDVIKEHFGVE